MVTVKIPAAWRQAAQGCSQVELGAGKLAEVVSALVNALPELRAFVYTEKGVVNPGVHFFVNQEHARFRGGMEAPILDGDEIYIIPMISGG